MWAWCDTKHIIFGKLRTGEGNVGLSRVCTQCNCCNVIVRTPAMVNLQQMLV